MEHNCAVRRSVRTLHEQGARLLFGLDDEQARLFPLSDGVLHRLQTNVAGLLTHVSPGESRFPPQDNGNLSLRLLSSTTAEKTYLKKNKAECVILLTYLAQPALLSCRRTQKTNHVAPPVC